MAARILGQRTLTTGLNNVYSVPAGAEAVCSTFIAVNTGTSAATLRVTAAPAGAADTLAHRLVHDLPLAPGQRLAITEGWTLAAGDVIRASGATGVVVTLFGSEITA